MLARGTLPRGAVHVEPAAGADSRGVDVLLAEIEALLGRAQQVPPDLLPMAGRVHSNRSIAHKRAWRPGRAGAGRCREPQESAKTSRPQIGTLRV